MCYLRELVGSAAKLRARGRSMETVEDRQTGTREIGVARLNTTNPVGAGSSFRGLLQMHSLSGSKTQG